MRGAIAGTGGWSQAPRSPGRSDRSRPVGRLRLRPRVLTERRGGQRDLKHRPPPCSLALDLDRAGVQLDDVARDRQPEAEPRVARLAGVGLPETIEHERQERPLDALSLIAHLQNKVSRMRSSRTSTRPPRSENLMAFESRFHTTWVRRCASPYSSQANGGTESASSTSRSAASRRTASIAACTASTNSMREGLSASLPAAMRASSRKSSTRRFCARALCRMIWMPSCMRSGSTRPERRSSAQPTIALKGVRSSCETVARNSLRALFAAASASRAAFRWSIAARGHDPRRPARAGARCAGASR